MPKKLAFLFLTLLLISVPDVIWAKSATTLVEVWCGGDDGLTQRVCAAVEHGFKSSPDFTLSYGKKPGTLLSTIAPNVDWKQVGKRMKVIYKVEFTTVNGQRIAAYRGSCWEDAISKCADQIVADAKTVASKTSSVP